MDRELKDKIDTLYVGRFGTITKENKFLVANETFSRNDILDCLESELNSANEVRNYISKKMLGKKINKILTIGSGSGRMGNELRLAWPNSIIYELDINKKVIERLGKKHASDTQRIPIVGSIERIPGEIIDVDLIVIYSVLRYVSDRGRAVFEVNRVLGKNGRAFVAEGKMSALIGEVKGYATKQQLKYKKFEINGVDLPRLTFFYWLLDSFEKGDEEIVNLVRLYMRNLGEKNVVKATFAMADSSIDSIYGFYWEKND